MKIMGELYGMSRDLISGQNLITIAYEGELGEEVNELTGKRITADLKVYRKKRSRNANNYMWELCTLIGNELQMSADDVYRRAISEMNVFKDFVLTESEAKTFKVVWEERGTGWLTEQVDYDEDGDRLIIRAYYGSSRYDSKQMSRLIQWLEDEAKELGITILSERERTLLLDKWKGALK